MEDFNGDEFVALFDDHFDRIERRDLSGSFDRQVLAVVRDQFVEYGDSDAVAIIDRLTDEA